MTEISHGNMFIYSVAITQKIRFAQGAERIFFVDRRDSKFMPAGVNLRRVTKIPVLPSGRAGIFRRPPGASKFMPFAGVVKQVVIESGNAVKACPGIVYSPLRLLEAGYACFSSVRPKR